MLAGVFGNCCLNDALFAAIAHIVVTANAPAATQAAASFPRFVFTRNLGCWRRAL